MRSQILIIAVGVGASLLLNPIGSIAQGQDCGGTCKVVYENNQYHVTEPCPDSTCYCTIPVVSGETACAPKNCQRTPTANDTAFIMRLGTEDQASQHCYLFEVQPDQPNAFLMKPVFVDLGDKGSWTIEVEYKDTANYLARRVPSVIVLPEPMPEKTQLSIVYAGGGSFVGMTHYNSTTLNTREYWFKRFKVKVTRTFPPAP